MDVDDESFFDSDFTTMMHPDFNLDDLDEILHDIDSNLQSAIDSHDYQPVQSTGCNEAYVDFSSNSTDLSSSPGEVSIKSESPSIISYSSSSSEENFDPDNFLNLDDDDVKMENLSDLSAASINHDSQNQFQSSELPICSTPISLTDFNANQNNDSQMLENKLLPMAEQQAIAQNSNPQVTPITISSLQTPTTFSLPTTALPLVQPQTFSLLQGTLIPVTTVPLTQLNLAKTSSILKPDFPVQITPLATTAKPLIKPKTIVLSAEDFKILKEKLENSKKNGTNLKSGDQLPKLVIKNTSPQLTIKSNDKPQSTNVEEMKLPATTTKNIKTMSDVKVFKSQIDEKTLKKQQRMIKNRESASLSRKKKREYVTSLEVRITDLEKENKSLKEENTKLRSHIISFIKERQSNNSKIKEFLSEKIKMNTNSIQTQTNSSPATSTYSVMRPRCSIKARLLNTSMKKNTAVLLAMVFMVSFNIGNFQTFLSRDVFNRPTAKFPTYNTDDETFNRDGFIWNDDDDTKWNHIDSTEQRLQPIEHLPLAIHRSTHPLSRRKRSTIDSIYPKCPINTNQTENLRLASELRKWINVNEYLNASNSKLSPASTTTTTTTTINNKYRTKLKLNNDNNYFDVENMKSNSIQLNSNANSPKTLKTEEENLFIKNSVQLHNEYFWLFKENNRRDDTNYVVSLSSDNILTLPASVYNKTTRPKMSLLLPGRDGKLKNSVILMQIDCEVMNITEVQLNYDMIPLKLRPKSSSTTNTPSQTNPNPSSTSDEMKNVTRNTNPEMLIKRNKRKDNLTANANYRRDHNPLIYSLNNFMFPKAKKFDGFRKILSINPKPNRKDNVTVAKQQNSIHYLP